MRLHVIRIGNSRGVRIPRAVLEACGIDEEVDMKVDSRRIILEPRRSPPRTGWAESLREMHLRGEDRLLLPEATDAEFKEWEW